MTATAGRSRGGRRLIPRAADVLLALGLAVLWAVSLDLAPEKVVAR